MANGTIAFDTLQTSGQITGTAKSVDTDYVVNGSNKAWGYLDGTGTVSLLNSFNVSTATDVSTGIYAFNFTNNFENINFCWAGICGNQAGNAANLSTPGAANTTSKVTCKNWVYNAALLHRDTNNVIVNGDLA